MKFKVLEPSAFVVSSWYSPFDRNKVSSIQGESSPYRIARFVTKKNGEQAVQELEKKMREVMERAAHEQLVMDTGASFNTLLDPDDFRAVVLGQSWLENAIILLIERHLHYRQKFNVAYMGFAQKLSLAAALGELADAEVPVLRALGTIRNKFAHRLDAKVSEEDAKLIKDTSSGWIPLGEMVLDLAGVLEGENKEIHAGIIVNLNGPQAVVRSAIWLSHSLLKMKLNSERPENPKDLPLSPEAEKNSRRYLPSKGNKA